MKPNRQECDECGHQLVNKTRLFAECPNCKSPAPFRWIAFENETVAEKRNTYQAWKSIKERFKKIS